MHTVSYWINSFAESTPIVLFGEIEDECFIETPLRGYIPNLGSWTTISEFFSLPVDSIVQRPDGTVAFRVNGFELRSMWLKLNEKISD